MSNELIQPQDGPYSKTDINTFDYRQYLRDSVTFRKILASEQPIRTKACCSTHLSSMYHTDIVKASHLPFISNFVTKCLKYASGDSSPNIQLLKEYFEHPQRKKLNIESFLCQSTTFHRAKRIRIREDLPSYEERQASAKMHVHYGEVQMQPRRDKYKSAYGFGASMVYDLRNFRMENFWGPFRNTGDASVDWEKMEAVMIVLKHNMEEYSTYRKGKPYGPPCRWPFAGAMPGSYVHRDLELPHKPPTPLADPHGLSKTGIDPYNVSGTWQRVSTYLYAVQ